MITRRLGHYIIGEKLGEGGMGQVYKANDTRLLRTVAIKVLPSNFLIDENHRRQFMLEARTASALNHPNICTIHDVSEEENVLYIVMELVHGETLRQILIRQGALPEVKAVDIGLQLCNALEAAHAHGILHCDIKPENIMIAHNGHVKVMDFGLARSMHSKAEKAIGHENIFATFSADVNQFQTSASTLQGTAMYMSPEQVLRKKADARSDIFSLGIVLFEMLSGIHPFPGKDSIAVMQAIVENDALLLPSSVSTKLKNIVKKTLIKNPVHRYENIIDLKNNLSECKTLVENKKIRTISFAGISVMIVMILLVFFVFNNKLFHNSEFVSESLKIYPVGLTSEDEYYPTFSPDGKKIIYSSAKTGVPGAKSRLWIRDIESGNSKMVSDYWGNMPDWSSDGRRIVFGSGHGLFIADTLEKNIQKIVEFGYRPRWSPDCSQIVFSTTSGQYIGSKNDIFLFNFKDSSCQQISPGNGLQYSAPYWSPDGRWIICIGGEGSLWELWLINPSTRGAQQFSRYNAWITNPVWNPSGDKIYFLSDKYGTRDIWRVPVNLKKGELSGSAIQVTTGMNITSMDISPTGERLIVSKETTNEKIWRVPLLKNSADSWAKAQPLGIHTCATRELKISPDGTKMVTETTEGGRFLKILCLQDSSEVVLTKEQQAFSPSWSADGKWIAFDAGGGNYADIWRIPAPGGKAEKIIDNPGADWMPTYSPDGRFICFLSNRSGQFDLWIKNLYSGEIFQITDSPESETRGFWSHNGDKIAFLRFSSQKKDFQVWLHHLDSGTSEKIGHFSNNSPNVLEKIFWRFDDKALYNWRYGKLRELSLENGQKRIVFTYHDPRWYNQVLDIYRNTIYFLSGERSLDLWMVEGLD